MKKNKLVVLFLTVQVLLIGLALHKDLGVIGAINFQNIISIVLFIMGWSLFSAVFAIFAKEESEFSYVSKFVFFLISSLNIAELLFISIGVILGGPLNESGLILIVFPFYGFFALIAGSILGTIVYHIKNRQKK